MKAPATTLPPIDFEGVARRANLEAVITANLGAPRVVRGKPCWRCPWHDDRTPSLYLYDGGKKFQCWPCQKRGNAIDWLVEREGMTPVEAARKLEPGTIERPAVSSAPPRPENWQEFVDRLVAEAEATLWSDDGSDARAYLRRRGLTEETIRGARLGLQRADEYVEDIFPEKAWVPAGITIPWFVGNEIVVVNVRRPDGSKPKYRTIRGSQRDGCAFSHDKAVGTGKPIAIVEGEFESLLLNQELAGLVPVITFGGASDRPNRRALDALLVANPWFIAVDADEAGSNSVKAWEAISGRCRRVRPPGAFKDWTELAQAGVNLRRWWVDRLGGNENPALFTWEELKTWSWASDPAPDALTIDIPADWQTTVARWPHAQWVAWRARSGELQADLGRRPATEGIRTADRLAFLELSSQGGPAR